jgi:hypothetical protein
MAGVPLAEPDPAATPQALHLRSLMRGQLRSSLIGFAALVVPTAALPLILALAAPSSGRFSGPVLTWVILGFAGYPALVSLAWWYVRRAERHERDFARACKSAE